MQELMAAICISTLIITLMNHIAESARVVVSFRGKEVSYWGNRIILPSSRAALARRSSFLRHSNVDQILR
jgi:hypothetical protein